MKKILLILLMLSLCLMMLASCKSQNGDGKINDTPDGGNNQNVIYSPDITPILVLGNGVTENDVRAVRTAYYRQTEKEIALVKADSSPAEHEIIVGETERDISKRAYRVLSMLDGEAGNVGYVIYSDGKSVAIAFDEACFGVNIAFTEAIEHFASEYIKDSSLKLEAGPVFYKLFDPLAEQSEKDDAIASKLWELKLSQISKKLNGNDEAASALVSELKKFCSIFNYDYEIVKWLANLYDPITGGFYYSNSARNNDGYLPDLDSTYKALIISNLIAEGYGRSLKDFLGEKITNNIISFVRNMQDSKDGYFYHPQWSSALINKNSERKDSDATAAVNILQLFNESPTYDAPSGVKGNGAVSAVSSLTAPLCAGCAAALSRVIAVNENDIYIPPHLRSDTAFISYLEELKIRSDTTAVCNTLFAEISLYRERDKTLEQEGASYRLTDLVMEYIKKYQNSASGLWTSGETSFKEIAELTDVVKLCSALGKEVPRYGRIINTIADFMSFEEDTEDITIISRSWSSLAAVVENALEYGIKFDVNFSLRTLYLRFGDLIKTTGELLSGFKKEYGSFSVSRDGGDAEYLGMPVSPIRIEEGNINGTFYVLNEIYLSVFKVLNIGYVPIFETADRMMFRKTLLDMGAIVKDDIVDEFEYEDFESFELGDASSIYLEYVIGAPKTSFEIKEDTVGTEKSKVLEWFADSGAAGNYLVFQRTHTRIGAYAAFFEADIKMNAFNEKTTKLEMDLRSSQDGHATVYAFAVVVSGKGSQLKVTGNNGADFSIPINVSEGEWFKLRIEYTDAPYDYNYDGTNDLIFRVYVNGSMLAEGHTPRNKDNILAGANIDNMRFKIESSRGCIVGLDNVLLGQCTMEYDEPAPADTDTITYEPGIITEKTQFSLGEGSSAMIVKTTVKGQVTKVLEIYSKAENQDKLTVTPTLTLDTANAIIFETDIMISPETDTSVLCLEPATKKGKQPFKLEIKATKDGDVTLSSRDSSGKQDEDVSNIIIGKAGEWIHLKIEYMNPYIDYTGDKKADILYKVYAGNTPELLATGHQLYESAAYYEPLKLINYVLSVTSGSEATVRLDNTRFWQSELTPDTPEIFPEEEDFQFGESAPDYNGWTQ